MWGCCWIIFFAVCPLQIIYASNHGQVEILCICNKQMGLWILADMLLRIFKQMGIEFFFPTAIENIHITSES